MAQIHDIYNVSIISLWIFLMSDRSYEIQLMKAVIHI